MAKITITIDDKASGFISALYRTDEHSVSMSHSIFVAEAYFLAKREMEELRIFTEGEIIALMGALNSWALDFRRSEPKSSLLFQLEDHYKLERFEEPDKALLTKIDALSEFHVWLLCRTLNMAWGYDDAIDKAEFWLKKP